VPQISKTKEVQLGIPFSEPEASTLFVLLNLSYFPHFLAAFVAFQLFTALFATAWQTHLYQLVC
jgi:hypothetical protein